MMPIGPLMIEHRLIERMIEVIRKKNRIMRKEREIDTQFIEEAADFIRTYADRCHHGKEEKILFRELEKKTLTDDHRRIMDELVEEHRIARGRTKKIISLNNRYMDGDKEVVEELLAEIDELAAMYPPHIEKEDKHFFIPVMQYFSFKEQENMLREENDFDRDFVHQIYKEKVTTREKYLADLSYRAFDEEEKEYGKD